MSDTSIVQTLTLNQATSFQTTTGINRVKIHNDSSYYLRVYFGLGPPSGANSSGWHETVGPGASPVLPVVGARQASSQQALDLTNNQSSATYPGQIVVMPFLPTGAPIPTGTVSGAALCYITGYYPDEFAETGGQIEAFVQAAKQGRLQVVDGGMPSHIGVPFYTDETTADATIFTAAGIGVTSTNAPALFAANAVGTSRIIIYLWDYFCTMRARTPAVARVNAWITPVLTDNAGVLKLAGSGVGPPLVLSAVNFGTDHLAFVPVKPLVMSISPTQGLLTSGDLVCLRYRLDTNAGHGPLGSFELTHVFSMQFDPANQSPLWAINGPNNIAAGLAAWNATYNPQTY